MDFFLVFNPVLSWGGTFNCTIWKKFSAIEVNTVEYYFHKVLFVSQEISKMKFEIIFCSFELSVLRSERGIP